MLCAKCGSDRIIPGAHVFDQGQGSGGRLQLGFYRKPDALILKGKVAHELSANICGECGYVEFFAQLAGEMYADYARANPNEVVSAPVPSTVPATKPMPEAVFEGRSASPNTAGETPAVARKPQPVANNETEIPVACESCGTPLGGADWCSRCGMRYSQG